jgi:Asp-tRNA(Asn)/Glu-tRNA(Gln) amidotransferase A subunit family amidase
MSLCALSLTQAAADIREGRMTSAELVSDCLERVDEVESKVQAWAFLDRDHAMQQAEAADLHRKQGKALGSLHGVPIGIKDIFDTADMPTELGSPLWAGRTPRRDAAAVARLRAAGAVIMGKTVTTEYAYFHPGKTTNPHDSGRTPGGSSSGSAAAVAAHMVPAAVGSQTNGSVIRPAAFCGVVGFKPTHGLIPRTGALLLSRTLDHVGVLARTVEDVALVAETLIGFDEEDPDTRPRARPPLAAVAASEPPLPPRLAFVRSPVWEHAESVTGEAFAELVRTLGEAVAEVELGAGFARAVEMHRTIMEVEMAHNLHRDYEKGRDRFSAVLCRLIERGRGRMAVDYAAAVAGIRSLNDALEPVFDEFDAIVTPAAPGEAPQGLERTGDPIFCTIWTYLGTPAVTLPLLRSAAGMPLGVQLVGRRDGDARLLRTARWLVASPSGTRRRRGQKERTAGRADSPRTGRRKSS